MYASMEARIVEFIPKSSGTAVSQSSVGHEVLEAIEGMKKTMGFRSVFKISREPSTHVAFTFILFKSPGLVTESTNTIEDAELIGSVLSNVGEVQAFTTVHNSKPDLIVEITINMPPRVVRKSLRRIRQDPSFALQ
jgi:hypothetical protein